MRLVAHTILVLEHEGSFNFKRDEDTPPGPSASQQCGGSLALEDRPCGQTVIGRSGASLLSRAGRWRLEPEHHRQPRQMEVGRGRRAEEQVQLPEAVPESFVFQFPNSFPYFNLLCVSIAKTTTVVAWLPAQTRMASQSRCHGQLSQIFQTNSAVPSHGSITT